MEDIKNFVFDHISDEKGGFLEKRELSEFVSGIASALLEGRGIKVKGAFRLILSETPCVVSEDSLYVIPYTMFPDSAELDKNTLSEAKGLSAALSLKLYSFPVSLYCLEGDGSAPIKGAGFVVKEGELEKS